MSDIDIAEMFLNFFLDWHLRKYAGVDLTSYFTDDLGKGKDTFWVESYCHGDPALAFLCSSYNGLAV
jgi:hypothetical protein